MSEDLLQEIEAKQKKPSDITVMGVGGAGGNAVNHMWDMGIEGVNFLVCNTDQQDLDKSPVNNKLRLGSDGLGAGNDPSKGRSATVESLEEIRCRLESLGTKMLFLTAGMGGGTGTGASPVVAKLAREMGILTVGIVTSPLIVKGSIRYNQAMVGIEEMRENVDSLLVLNNEHILELYGRLPIKQAFSKADDILCSAAKGIAEIVTVKSELVNVDFADVCRVMRNSGRAHMSVESAAGENRAEVVANRALLSPLLDNSRIDGADNILMSLSVANLDDLSLDEVSQIMEYIQHNATVYDANGKVVKNASIIWGASEKPHLAPDAIELMLVATGLHDGEDELSLEEQEQIVVPKPFNRSEVRAAAEKAERPIPAVPPVSTHPTPTVSSRQVVLGEPTSRYKNIDAMLSQPAYKRHNAKFIVEVSSARRETLKEETPRNTEPVVDENLLFPHNNTKSGDI